MVDYRNWHVVICETWLLVLVVFVRYEFVASKDNVVMNVCRDNKLDIHLDCLKPSKVFIHIKSLNTTEVPDFPDLNISC